MTFLYIDRATGNFGCVRDVLAFARELIEDDEIEQLPNLSLEEIQELVDDIKYRFRNEDGEIDYIPQQRGPVD